MLYFPQTSIEISRERAVAAGAVIRAEGSALVADLTGGVYGVKASTGTTGEKLAGVSVNNVTALVSVPRIQNVVVSAAGKILLDAEAIPGTLRVVRAADKTVYTEGSSAGATAYDVDNTNPRILNLVVGDAAKAFQITYEFSPTVLQATQIQGNQLPGGPAGQYLGQVGVITRGDVFTTEWDTTADWSTAVGVKLSTNGKFTSTAVAADVLPGTQLIELPTAGRGYLGVNINCAA